MTRPRRAGVDGAPVAARVRRLQAASMLLASVACAGTFAGCTVLLDANSDQCNTTQDCTVRGGAFANMVCSASRVCVKNPGCSGHRECIEQHGGQPYACRSPDRVCVPLETPDCRWKARPADVANDDTVWVGAMLPVTGPEAPIGSARAAAMDLARAEIIEYTAGLPAHGAGRPARPIGIIACDDSTDAQATASVEHLVRGLHVPAILGFRSTAVAVRVAKEFALATNTYLSCTSCFGPELTALPSRDPRLVWRGVPPVLDSLDTWAIAAAVPAFVEPRVRRANPPDVSSSSAPVRVAVVYPGTASGLAAFDAIQPTLRFNGKTIVENGDKHFVALKYDPARADASLQYAYVRNELGKFHPHIVIGLGAAEIGGDIIGPYEDELDGTAEAFRPYYALTGGALKSSVIEAVAKHPELDARLSGATFLDETHRAEFAARYQAEYTPLAAADATLPAASYDAFYALVLAIVAAGNVPLDGLAIARGMSKLVAPLPAEPTAPPFVDIFKVEKSLQDGASIRFSGVFGPFDWNLETGDPNVVSYQCLGTSGVPSWRPSGRTFNPVTRAIEGAPLDATCL